ncbi:hypothetical protein, partial [Pseudomonas putida]|uniref:hypothetical protein n=1 Tax=Pseudomonas putida TaxID=303 RepID=UPI002097C24F
DSVRRSVHQANLVKIRACLAAGHYRPEHKKTDSPCFAITQAALRHCWGCLADQMTTEMLN